MEFFETFFARHKEQLARLLDAGGCREGWIQGQMFLDAPPRFLKTNATKRNYDLYSEAPLAIGEIKICGGDYQPKMQGRIEKDVKKLRQSEATEKYMILIVDTRVKATRLGKWLASCDFAREEYREFEGRDFKVRVWKITA